MSTGSTVLLPFSGLLMVTIAGACCCNLYGGDANGIWTLTSTPGIARTGVRPPSGSSGQRLTCTPEREPSRITSRGSRTGGDKPVRR